MVSKSPFVVTSATFTYHDLRGLTRSLSLDLPINRSKVHLTSAAVNGLPSCHCTPWRNGKVSSVPSSFHDQPVARSGMIDCGLFCATSCLYMTRLLNTPDIGRLTAIVDSSSGDMLAGLSKWPIFITPPCFCAQAGQVAENPKSVAPAATIKSNCCLISPPITEIAVLIVSWSRHLVRDRIAGAPLPGRLRNIARPPLGALIHCRVLFVEPEVFHAPAIENAVDDDRQPLDPRLEAGPALGIKDDRSCVVLGQ